MPRLTHPAVTEDRTGTRGSSGSPGATRRTLLATVLLSGAADLAPPLLLDAPAGPGTLRVLNPGSAAVTVAGAVDVESLYEGQWGSTGVCFFMVERCGSRDPETAALQPGIPFMVMPWTGWSCSGQCSRPCRANVPLAGTFHPVLMVLPTGVRLTGPCGVFAGCPSLAC